MEARSTMLCRLVLGTIIGLFLNASASAFPVGERHLIASEPSAVVRDAQHRSDLRITVWYPAATDAVELPLDIGPSRKPLFKPGSAAPDAPFADAKARPVILLSHGFGGTARIMAWFATALAKEGYIVVAVDHPGNNGMDQMTLAGAAMPWERPGDLSTALFGVMADSALSSHLDGSRLGIAGFSAGGFTSLVSVGARVDLNHYREFCQRYPNDGVCKPQKEFSVTLTQAEAFLASPDLAPEVAKAKTDLSIPGLKAAFVMAPAIVQSLDPGSLQRIKVPVSIILGDADTVAPPATNGEFAAKVIPDARIKILPGVGHYDFVATCTPAGDASVEICPTRVPRTGTHATTIADALRFFARAIGKPPQ